MGRSQCSSLSDHDAEIRSTGMKAGSGFARSGQKIPQHAIAPMSAMPAPTAKMIHGVDGG